MGDSRESNAAAATTEKEEEEEEEEEGIMRKKRGHVSFSIWPPSDRTREAVRSRLVETLSKPSILSKRYGTMPSSEAEEYSQRIEAEAYDSASSSSSVAVVVDAEEEKEEDGMEVLQAYSKEISRLMLEAIKSRSPSSPVDDVSVNDKVKEEEEEEVVLGSVKEN